MLRCSGWAFLICLLVYNCWKFLSGQSALTLKPMDNYLHLTSSILYLFLGYAFVRNQNFSGFLELGYWLWTFIYFHESVKYDHPGKCGAERDCLWWHWLTFRQSEGKSSSRSSDHQGHFTLMTTSAQVVETPVNVTINSPSQDYTYPDDHTSPTYDNNNNNNNNNNNSNNNNNNNKNNNNNNTLFNEGNIIYWLPSSFQWYDSWVQITCYIHTLIARENRGYELAL